MQQSSWDHEVISMKIKVGMIKDSCNERGQEKKRKREGNFNPVYNIVEPDTVNFNFSGNGRK